MSDVFDPYLLWLGIRDPQRPPNHYRLLGIDLFESDPEIIQSAFDRQVGHIRKFQAGAHAAWAQQILSELATARLALLHPARKAAYDGWLHQSLTAAYVEPLLPPTPPAESPPVPEEFPIRLEHSDAEPPRRWTGLLVALSLTTILLLAAIAALLVWRDRLQRQLAALPSRAATASPSAAPARPSGNAPTPSSAEAASSGTNAPPKASPANAPQPVSPSASPAAVPASPASPAGSEAVEPPPRSEQSLSELMASPESPSPAEAPALAEVPSDSVETLPAETLPAQSPGTVPIPEPAAQQAMRAEIHRIFQQEYAAAVTPEKKQALAVLLVKQASETADDPVACYVMLTEARDLAADAGDSPTFLQSLTDLSGKFSIDSVAMAADSLEQAAKRSRTPAGNALLARTALKLIDSALRDDQYPQAGRLASAGRDLARKAADAALLKEAVSRGKEVEDKRQNYQQYQEAGERLKTNPDDADARRVQGTYLCFTKSDWEHGLPLLAKSGDATLESLAKAEANPPTDTPSTVALGDLWWDAARAAQPAMRPGMLSRSAHWYRTALPHLRGFTHTKVERRLDEIDPGGP